MRLLELEIFNFRGIRQLSITPAGENFVIWGANGSGKSAVVDALDFLLTGHISHLMGEGTGDIQLTRHGPHVDSDPASALVRGRFRLSGDGEEATISRTVEDANLLVFDDNQPEELQRALSAASKGQHVLSRREILKYITSDAGTRASEIHALLNLRDIEAIRKSLVTVRNETQREADESYQHVERCQATIATTAGIDDYGVVPLLRVVNSCRERLLGTTVDSVESAQLKTGLTPPSDRHEMPVTQDAITGAVEHLNACITPERLEEVTTTDDELRRLLAVAREDANAQQALECLRLTELGLTLLGDDEICPLCKTPWPPGALKDYLEGRVRTAAAANEAANRISELSVALRGIVNRGLAAAQNLRRLTERAGITVGSAEINAWNEELRRMSDALGNPLANYVPDTFSADAVQRLVGPEDVAGVLRRVQDGATICAQAPSPQQAAWDLLTRLEENVCALDTAESELSSARSLAIRGHDLYDAFCESRDEVLGALYDEIREDFVALYLALHGEDEDAFAAELSADGAGLKLAVDFHGRGVHPPHALHSEGHQDTMGLCLYLVLCEKLNAGIVDLVILDDVIMSVDAEHRRAVCRLLAEQFPHRQFLITTHDRTWSNQLRTEGLVCGANRIELHNWRIETGPQVNQDTEVWDRILHDLEAGDVSGAAAKLRRGAEEFFATACDGLRAPVPFQLSQRWELGDLMPAAQARYKRLIKKAKVAAVSWHNAELAQGLTEVENIASQVYARTNAEQWAVNPSVHYSAWANLSVEDFRPVVEAFQDLWGVFTCSSCEGILGLAMQGTQETCVKCACGQVTHNLVPNR